MSKSLQVIFLIVGLDAVGFGLIMPILPDLLKELSHLPEVAHHYGFFLSIYALMQFLFSPILGALSDRFGRRPVLLVSLAGAAIDYVVMALAPNLTLLYVGRIVAGITGANMAVATSSIADVSTDQDRAKNFGFMNAAFGIGFVIGPVIGGLFGETSHRLPFLIAAVLNGVSFSLGLFALKESLPEDKRRQLQSDAVNPFRSLFWVGSIRSLLPFLILYVIINLAGQMPGSLWTISNQDRYGWSIRMVGASLAAYGLLLAFFQACVTGPITKKLGEFPTLLIGLTTECLCYVLFAFATETWMVFVIMIPLCFGGVAIPALQSLITRQVSESQQGELQGTLISLMSLTTIFGPLLFTRAYSTLPPDSKGLAWLVAAALYLLCLPLVRVLRRSNRAFDETAQENAEMAAADASSA